MNKTNRAADFLQNMKLGSCGTTATVHRTRTTAIYREAGNEIRSVARWPETYRRILRFGDR